MLQCLIIPIFIFQRIVMILFLKTAAQLQVWRWLVMVRIIALNSIGNFQTCLQYQGDKQMISHEKNSV